MKVCVIEAGVDYEGSVIAGVLDHFPTQEEFSELMKDQYTGSDAYCHISGWEVNGKQEERCISLYPLDGGWDLRNRHTLDTHTHRVL